MKGYEHYTIEDFEPDGTGHRLKRNVHARNTLSVSASDVEPGAGNALLGVQGTPRLDGRCRVYVYSKRHKLTDPGGRCDKYLIDAIVSTGVLPDDSALYIEEPIIATQEKIPKTQAEETILTLVWES